MGGISFPIIAIFAILIKANSEELATKMALIQFMEKLSPGKQDPSFGWTSDTDPCTHKWKGITCDSNSQFVKNIVLEKLNLTGIFAADSLCNAAISSTLLVLSLKDNNVGGIIPGEISNCKKLTHLFLSNNLFWGKLPNTLQGLSNLKRLDLSNNDFSGEIPNLSRISGLKTFLSQNNQLNGQIPKFDFSNLQQFNVSNNNLSGVIPDMIGDFKDDSFLGNPELCGKPLPYPCPSPTQIPDKKHGYEMVLIYSGYGIIGLVLTCVLVYKLVNRKGKQRNIVITEEYYLKSGETSRTRSSLMILSTPFVNRLSFHELLSSPAELVSRNLYKVTVCGGALSLAVKRIKNLSAPVKDDFEKRMVKIDRAKHPNVLPVVAYYCSNQEKLLVYEFQSNDSLFNLLLGSSQNGELFEWEKRLNVACKIAEALAFMHDELFQDGIGHGNVKSSNIVFNEDMSPCLSEYGLRDEGSRAYGEFEEDVFGFGVVLAELVNGKVVDRNENVGYNDLVKWVESMVEKEQVFDGGFVVSSEGVSSKVSLLQLALQCLNLTPQARPTMMQVSSIINSIIIYHQQDKSM